MCVLPNKTESSLEAGRSEKKVCSSAPVCLTCYEQLFPTRTLSDPHHFDKSQCGGCQGHHWQRAKGVGGEREWGGGVAWAPPGTEWHWGAGQQRSSRPGVYESLERRCEDRHSFVCAGRLKFQTHHHLSCYTVNCKNWQEFQPSWSYLYMQLNNYLCSRGLVLSILAILIIAFC